jgi:phenylalanyl-tRNA synthetase alpha chain
MMTQIKTVREQALQTIAEANSLELLDQIRVSLLGKKGLVSDMMRSLATMNAEDRKIAGQNFNLLKDEIAESLSKKKDLLEEADLEEKLSREWIDVTLPLPSEAKGRIHPISQTIEEITTIFAQMGFTVAEGPDIEDDFHNFTALNFPQNHPARQMHDTFFLRDLKNGQPALLRTHTSPVQVRTMLSQKPPIRIIAPGRTYRCDSDMTHTPMFHQVEGLVIDKKIHMGHLKGCLISFVKSYFELDKLPVRFRPSFFPFTEPSAEMDIGCSRQKGRLDIGEGADWLEILGCGMVHPHVLLNCGIDPNDYQGFAFGLGIERMAMLKYGIPDLRAFFESDLRWLRHYGFLPFDIPSNTGGLSR